MKKTANLILAIVLCNFAFAQSPQKMSYQAVVRDASNQLVQNTTVGTRISILSASPSGSVVYSETHAPLTNDNGIFTIEIGTGSVQSGTFTTIDWPAAEYWMKTEIDINGGSNYTITAVSQLLSVPYAFYANSSGNEIEQVIDNGDTTLTFEFANGTTYTTPVLSSFQGIQGVSIVNTYIQDDSLRVVLSNGQNLNAGCLNCNNLNLCSVTTSSVTNITANTATINTTITDGGGELVLGVGACYSTSPNPTVEDPKVIVLFPSAFNVPVQASVYGLTAATTYYTRAFATNTNGTSYGQEQSFTTAPSCIAAGQYNGSVNYYISTSLSSSSIIYSNSSAAATLIVNSDMTYTLSFPDPASPLSCNTSLVMHGNIVCNSQSSGVAQIMATGVTGGSCTLATSSGPGPFSNFNPYVSFSIGTGSIGGNFAINDGGTRYISLQFTF